MSATNMLLTTPTGHTFYAYTAQPTGQPKGTVIILHEAFGVTPHIEWVCQQYAQLGYLALAPALLSWATGNPQGEVLAQDKAGLDRGRDLILATKPEQVVETVATCAQHAAGQGLKAAVIGYCWGGSVAYLTASQLPQIAACSAYYGGRLAEIVKWGQPTCPRIVHLATQDRYIPLQETIAAFKQHDPHCPVHIYQADHGFNRHDGKTYHQPSADLALSRTLAILTQAFNS
ncbi:MAG: dienelactone hydrolase family protein [Proteobacteria bacterium]|nr:dienelactone hydrolase family protein [Pseudomonadota bacterium]NBX86821.1 dienelactone hydrolase family protein [Pseudomonadota bacterium]